MELLPPVRADRGAFERIQREIEPGTLAGTLADLLADVEHRRLVALAFADHDLAVELDRVQHLAHGLDRGVIGGLLVTATHEPRALERGGLGHADEFHCEVTVHGAPPGVAEAESESVAVQGQ